MSLLRTSLSFLPNYGAILYHKMRSIKTILAATGRRAKSMEIGDSVSVEPDSTALMPLIIEKTSKGELSVGHFHSQEGDLLADPEVVFDIEGEHWVPIRFRQDPHLERIDHTGLDLGDFLRIWDKNLRRQRYVDTENS